MNVTSKSVSQSWHNDDTKWYHWMITRASFFWPNDFQNRSKFPFFFFRSKNLKIGNCFNLFGKIVDEMISKLGTNWCKSASLLGALKCMASKWRPRTERERDALKPFKNPKKAFCFVLFVFLFFFFAIKISVASQVGRLITLQLLLALPGFVYSTVDDFLKHICL